MIKQNQLENHLVFSCHFCEAPFLLVKHSVQSSKLAGSPKSEASEICFGQVKPSLHLSDRTSKYFEFFRQVKPFFVWTKWMLPAKSYIGLVDLVSD